MLYEGPQILLSDSNINSETDPYTWNYQYKLISYNKQKQDRDKKHALMPHVGEILTLKQNMHTEFLPITIQSKQRKT